MYDDLKWDLCRGARVLYHRGLSMGIAGHLSIKVAPDTMIANRFGPSFGTVVPKDVLTLGLDGSIKEGQGYVNDTIRLHGVIHRRNPDIVALAHTHPPAVVSFSTLQRVPLVYDQESCFLADEVGIVEEDYSGLASSEERVQPMAEELARHRAIILPNHGAVTAGATIRHAIILMLLLEGMAARNISVMMMTGNGQFANPRPISTQVAVATKKELAGLQALGMVWDDLMAKLRKTDPELFPE